MVMDSASLEQTSKKKKKNQKKTKTFSAIVLRKITNFGQLQKHTVQFSGQLQHKYYKAYLSF